MKKVIVFGSLNMDLTIQCDRMPQSGETVEGHDLLFNAGGKGGNQAVAAAKSGACTELIACVGNDTFGEQLLESLKEYQVGCRQVRVSTKEKTGIAFITRHEGDNRIILSSGANHELLPEDVRELLSRCGQEGDLFVTQFECRNETVFASLKAAKELGMYTILNPAPAKEIPEEMFRYMDLIVLNQSECQFLTGVFPEEEESCKKALEALDQLGCSDVIITLGSKGSIGRTKDGVFEVAAHKVEVVDTTAAGDTYIGALAAGLAHEKTMEESVKFATRAAALTIMKCGAQQSIPYKEEIETYFN